MAERGVRGVEREEVARHLGLVELMNKCNYQASLHDWWGCEQECYHYIQCKEAALGFALAALELIPYGAAPLNHELLCGHIRFIREDLAVARWRGGGMICLLRGSGLFQVVGGEV